jgi:hypothetical protein
MSPAIASSSSSGLDRDRHAVRLTVGLDEPGETIHDNRERTMKTSTTRSCIAVALAATCLAGAWTSVSAHDGDEHAAPATKLTGVQRTVIREATKHFRDVEAAIDAGYVPTEACAALPDVGGMGYHYVNPTLIGDTKIDPTMPEILVYYRDSKGRLMLGAVEYFAADADQDLTTDEDRPTLMGHAFDGPMPGHEPGMPVHYDLHAWVFLNNPLGELAAWNPRVTCPTP